MKCTRALLGRIPKEEYGTKFGRGFTLTLEEELTDDVIDFTQRNPNDFS